MELAGQHPDRAEALLRKGIAAGTQGPELRLMLADLLLDQKKLDGDEGATVMIERIRKLGVHDGYVQYLLGRAAIVKTSWDQATAHLQSARSLLAGDLAMLERVDSLLGECYRQRGELEIEPPRCRRAASGGEAASPAARLLYAEDLEREGRLDAAVAVHLGLAAVRPESRLDMVRLLTRKNARLPEDQRRWQDVEQRFQEASQALPSEVEDLTILRADLTRFEGKPDEAARDLERAIQASPKSLRYRIALAGLLDEVLVEKAGRPRGVKGLLGLGTSRGIVLRLSALFALDAFGGGFVVQSFAAYWFYLRFGVEPATLGGIFFGANVFAGISALLASRLAARIGLVKTMVFTIFRQTFC